MVPPAAPSSKQSPPLSTDIPDSEVLTSDLSSNSDSDDSIPPDLDVPIALRKGMTIVGVGGSPRVPLSGIPGEEDQN